MALFFWSDHTNYSAVFGATPERGLRLNYGVAKLLRIRSVYTIGILVLMLAGAIGCRANILSSTSGWTAVATGEVIGVDGSPRPVAFVGTEQGELLALDTQALKAATIGAGHFTREQITSGGLMWSFQPDVEDALGGVFGPPAVGEALVYFAVTNKKNDNGILYALSKDRPNSVGLSPERGEWARPDGEERRLERPIIEGAIVGGPMLTLAEDKVLVGTDGGVFYAFDAKTGEIRWRYPFVGNIGEIWSTPVVDEERVYFGSLDHKVYALSLEDGSLEWSFPTGGAVVARPLLVGENVIVGSFDRKLYRIDARTGAGSTILQADNWFWAGAVTSGDSIFATSMDGKVHILDLAGNPMGAVTIEGTVVSTPGTLKAEGKTMIVVANESGGFYILSPNMPLGEGTNGEGRAPLAGQVFGGKVKAPLIGEGNILFVGGTGGGTVWGLVLENQNLSELWQVDIKG